MSTIFNKLKNHAKELEAILRSRAFLMEPEHESQWYTRNYTSAWTRRANLDVIDATESKKLFMMHLCIFPHVFDKAPIYGFDIIAGTNKITGAFLDSIEASITKLSTILSNWSLVTLYLVAILYLFFVSVI